ncbi:unnamed protein product [Caenorhabditis sp. 36 PRJEB53466]|nr:unnamed protein product [Caenorhabditis sp. 36 PRJEB53466]
MSGPAAGEEGGGSDKKDELVFNVGDTIHGYKIVKKIDEGGFGQVFKVTDKKQDVFAMKVEPSAQEGGSAIKLEVHVLQNLPTDSVFPRMVLGGRKRLFHYMVLELLGDNLRTLKARSTNPEVWSDGTWSRVGIQCLYALKVMHNYGFVHRDVKPNNFAIGINTATEIRNRRIMLFDFGLARRFVKQVPVAPAKRLPSTAITARTTATTTTTKTKMGGSSKPKKTENNGTKKQKESKEKVMGRLKLPSGAGQKIGTTVYEFRIARPHTDFRGTQQYASPNAHAQLELGRHDDIWSLMYMIAEMFVELPWAFNDSMSVEDFKKQYDLPRIFCDAEKNAGMRGQLEKIDSMLKSKNYYEHPDYECVQQFLKDVMTRARVGWEDPYDWETNSKSAEVVGVVKKAPSTVKITGNEWETPGEFFKTDMWARLKMPSYSMEMAEKKRLAASRADRGKQQLSHEQISANQDEELKMVKTPTGKSLKKMTSVGNLSSNEFAPSKRK